MTGHYLSDNIYIIVFILIVALLNVAHDKNSKNQLKKGRKSNKHQVEFLEREQSPLDLQQKTRQKIRVDKNLVQRIKTYNNQTTRINLNPVKLPKNYKGTIIVAFSDINYWPAGRLWFQRMKTLGYANVVRMYALDKLAHQEMLSEVENGDMELENVYFPKDFGEDFEVIEIQEDFVRRDDYDAVFADAVNYRTKSLRKVWQIHGGFMKCYVWANDQNFWVERCDLK